MSAKTNNLKVPRLGKNRHGVFFVRASELDGAGRRKVYQLSLGTKDPQLARVLALRFCLSLAERNSMPDPRDFMGFYDVDAVAGKVKTDGSKYDHQRAMEAIRALQLLNESQIRLAQAKADADVLARAHIQEQGQPDVQNVVVPPQVNLAADAAIQTVTQERKKSPLFMLRAALDAHYAEEVSANLAERTLGEKRVLFDEFVDCFGDVPLATITELEVTARWRPLEFGRENKKYPGQKVSPGRWEKRRTYLSKFFKWAFAAKLYPHDSPVAQKMATKKTIRSQTSSYIEFNSDDLAKLFRGEYAVNMDKPDFYWLPLMAMYSGARLSEMADLKLDDIEEREGIKVYEIVKAKTPESLRTVPIHSCLLELGFWEYVQSLKSKGLTQLVSFRPVKSLSKRAGATWSAWVKSSGIKNRRKTFHSFRPTAITDMHNGPAGDAQIRGAVGHTGSSATDIHNQYIRGIRLINVKKAIETLNFPTVHIQDIKLQDPTFATFIDGEIEKANDPVKAAKAARVKANRIKRAAMDERVRRSGKPHAKPSDPPVSVIFRKRKPAL